MGRGDWWATVCGAAESDTTERLSNLLIGTLHLDIVCFFHRKGENNYIKFYRSFQGFLQKKKSKISPCLLPIDLISWGLCMSKGPHTQKDPTFGITLCFILKFLIMFDQGALSFQCALAPTN